MKQMCVCVCVGKISKGEAQIMFCCKLELKYLFIHKFELSARKQPFPSITLILIKAQIHRTVGL